MVIATFLCETDFAVAAGAFSETWEACTNNVTPYGGWFLDKGNWGAISSRGFDGGKCYTIPAGMKSRIQHRVDLSKCKNIVLQGWFYDSAVKNSRSVLALYDKPEDETPLLRVGINAPQKTNKTYTIVFHDRLQAEKQITVDTRLPFETGWHFIRLEILQDRTVTYRLWNAARTDEKSGNFAWVFDRAKLNYVAVGSMLTTGGDVAWDDIKVGDLEEIGPPPALAKPIEKPRP